MLNYDTKTVIVLVILKT
ncbi:hypothetical protein Goshw_023295 [Gossypium schwendimanii]|uniref:Uncharacterized protein n=1 Tax=Gossypium schwendimanii TaxID=34291 RepID=A0A7J9LXR6_GOSSC|nr:hypothetical protein [Gossypium schwendimanii]